ncbi:CHAT domain-containing protein [Actinoplanes sp. NPDC051470]|uniref:CHAT domain-containing protein n=1 Tax=Actinoplanes sp. NPDC051470 TaxID=3157224 RepID=UPI00341F6D82
MCLSGPDASAEAVRTYAAGSRYVHFAVHALARDDEPLYSALALAGGPLHAYELFSLDLCADVVTLSACASAVGADRSGEGIVGLSRALFAAGARAVLLTRWPVHDRPMRTLVEAFYRSLSEGHPPAEALAEAVRLVRRGKPAVFAHPRERWPFMLIETGWR